MNTEAAKKSWQQIFLESGKIVGDQSAGATADGQTTEKQSLFPEERDATKTGKTK
jgi:hypothetical protein